MIGPAAHTMFFPLAVTQGAIGLGIWTFLPGGGANANWHAHEIVFGYATAVMPAFS